MLLKMRAFLAPCFPQRSTRSRARQKPLLCAITTNSPSSTRLCDSYVLPPIVFVLGGPGSGKGTQCAKLKNDFDFEQVCVGDLLRREAARETRFGKSIAEIMQRGDIVPGEITMKLLKEELHSLVGRCSGILIDGFPRAMDQAKAFEDLVAACCFVLFFQCDESEMVMRLLRRGETSGRADDHAEVVRKRLRTFIEKTMPVVEYYRERGLLREVDSGNGDPDQVYLRTKELFHTKFASL